MEAARPAARIATAPPASRAYLAYVLVLLFLIDVLKVADKLILGIVTEPLKLEFSLSDTQLGLLSGVAFAIVYSFFGLPLAQWADRGERRRVIALCVAGWSIATAACGMATTFVQLLAARIGVAVGESGLTPAAHSMIADLFKVHERGRALAVFSLGSAFGTFFGISFGGYVAGAFGWREALFALGIPGVVLAVLFYLTVREPRRGQSEAHAFDDKPVPMARAFGFIWRARSYRYLTLAASAHLLVTYGISNWLVPFFMRSHQASLADIALLLGPIIAASGSLGALAGGIISDRFGKDDLRWYVFTPAWSVLLAAPLSAAIYLWPSMSGALALLSVAAVLNAMWQAPAFALVQILAPVRQRATAAAVFIFFINLVGYGGGPLAVGALSDLLSESFGVHSLRWALAGLSLVGFPAAALFYWLSSRHVRADMARAAS